MFDLLLSKIMPPQRTGDIINRPGIIRALSIDGHKATFLTAPAGYGKTIAMLQASGNGGRVLAWY